MRLQLLSDLHLETEAYDPEPAPGAELLVLAGDIDAGWHGYARFRDWPVPVVAVAGNHEFDGRDLDAAGAALRAHCAACGVRLLERDSMVGMDDRGRRIRFLGTVRWSDFDLFGETRRARAMKSGGYFLRLMGTTRRGGAFDAPAVREEALACRDWLEGALSEPADGRWDRTVVVTHFAPSLASADPRYGAQPSTASFCNRDDDLLPKADLWLHGHLHAPSDYRVERPGDEPTRVVANPRGHRNKNEPAAHRPQLLIEV